MTAAVEFKTGRCRWAVGCNEMTCGAQKEAQSTAEERDAGLMDGGDGGVKVKGTKLTARFLFYFFFLCLFERWSAKIKFKYCEI